MRLLSALVVAASLSACVSARELDELTLSADGVTVVQARVERGDIEVSGRGSATEFQIFATRFGTGSSKDAAQQRADVARWSADIVDRALVVDASSTENRSGTDFEIFGPTLLDLDMETENGTIDVDEVEGFHVLTADRIEGTMLGDVDAYASSTIDMSFVPYVETDTVIESEGSVILALPYGLDYDLTVRTNGTDEMVITDLGMDREDLGDGFYSGLRGRGLVEIDVFAGGRVEILELR